MDLAKISPGRGSLFTQARKLMSRMTYGLCGVGTPPAATAVTSRVSARETLVRDKDGARGEER